MNRCPITYDICEQAYSQRGLTQLSKTLNALHPLPFSAVELRQEASSRAGEISIQGVQPKLSARLSLKNRCFKLVDKKGHYILKPQTADYEQVPENEDLTMKLAALAGIDVPVHGLVYGKDQELTYFIRRFDRTFRNQKLHVEDFAQLSGKDRDTKYNSSMEQVIKIIDQYCTFPAVEKVKLFRIVVFCFLTGNEDMHLKNFSLIHKDKIYMLSPAYDLLNTTIIVPSTREEAALPINGKKNRLSAHDLIRYFAGDRLKLTDKVIERSLTTFQNIRQDWLQMIDISFLNKNSKSMYKDLLSNRYDRLFNQKQNRPSG